MTTNFGFDIKRENRIFDFAEASLKLYKLSYTVTSYIGKAADHFIAMLAVIVAIGLILVVLPVFLILLSALSIGLIYSIIFFTYHQKKGYKGLLKLERKDLIELHLKMRHTLKKMESLKSSDFLFSTPVLGYLMSTYFKHLTVVEKVLKDKAYPNYNIPPKNSKIHDYNPSDPWQKDMSDLQRYHNLPIS